MSYPKSIIRIITAQKENHHQRVEKLSADNAKYMILNFMLGDS